jgi:hypothetical protein
VAGAYQWLAYEVVDGEAIHEGDVLLGRYDDLDDVELGEREPDRAAIYSGHQWPGGVVPYTVDGDLPQGQRQALQEAMDVLHATTSIRFVARTSEPDWLRVVHAPGVCASHIGRIGGEQRVMLGAGCGRTEATHELAHALGMFHEQSRVDRDEHVIIHWDDIDPSKHHNFQTFVEQGKAGANFGPYDHGSIMHYRSDAFARYADRPSITRLDGTLIGYNAELSAGDYAALEARYPPPPVVQPCGEVDYFGRCDGTVLSWCWEGQLVQVDCALSAEGGWCAWQDDAWGHNCMAPAP